MGWEKYNPNPTGARVGDCTVRAISRATGQSWEKTFVGLCVEAFRLCDMPSSNHVWGAYLKRKGFKRLAIPDELPENYSVSDFCRDNPKGTYILAISGHVVCAQNGNYCDSWDSGAEIPIYYWIKEEEK